MSVLRTLDYLLMRSPKESPKLYRYSLGFPPQSELIENPQISKAMEHRLKAYVQTGLTALRGRQVGLPRQDQ